MNSFNASFRILRRLMSSSSRRGPNYPPLDESTLSEQFVLGSGPGGQKINKTQNKVVLTHHPTGTVVHCQETRSLHENQRIARERMQEKLDVLANGDQAVSVVAERLQHQRARYEHGRSVQRLALKRVLKAELSDKGGRDDSVKAEGKKLHVTDDGKVGNSEDSVK